MPTTLSDVLRLPVAVPTQLAKDVSSLVDSVGRLPNLITTVLTEMRGLATDVAILRETALGMAERLDALGLQIGVVEQTVVHADDRVDRIGALVESLTLRVAHIDDGLDARIPDLAPLPDDVARIARDVARVLELTPEPQTGEEREEPSTLSKVRDALTAGD